MSFSYDTNPTLKNISFQATAGENITIIGESGCGKSTLLKLIYGIYDLNEGKILFDNKTILGPKFNLIPGEEYIKYLSQDFGLMPYITVGENVGKFLSNVDKNIKQSRITELLTMVEMLDFEHTKPKYLSGGQQQRVAIAMVLANEPKILLLDEPFSQIDNFRKNSLRRNLFKYLKSKNIICIITTHDINDGLSFSDQMIILKDGNIVEKGKSKLLFENPKSKYVGSLFNEINEIETKYLDVESGENTFKLIYSFQLEITPKSKLKVCVTNNYYRGNYYLIEAMFDNKILFFNSAVEIEINSFVYLKFIK